MPTLHAELTKTSPYAGRDAESASHGRAGDIVDNERTKEVGYNRVPSKTRPKGAIEAEDPVICKLEPFNICYRLDSNGNMHPLGDRRPVRLIRVY